MLNKLLSLFVYIFLSLLLTLLVHSCANIAAPTGGAYDIDPPVVRSSTPEFNSLNSYPERVEIEFDENIKLQALAERLGYDAYSTFYKNFKKLTGMTPAQYISKNKNSNMEM